MQEKKTSKRKLPASETENSIFATNLRTMMQQRGENQTTLAKKIGVKRQTISLYMNGQSIPNTEILVDIANALDVSADYLLGLSDIPLTVPDLQAACSYTGLSMEAVQKIRSLKDSWQLLGHSISTPDTILTYLCEHKEFTDFLQMLSAAFYFFNPHEIDRDHLLEELGMRLGRETVGKLSFDDLMTIVPLVNEHLGYVSLQNKDVAEYHLTLACETLKRMVRSCRSSDAQE